MSKPPSILSNLEALDVIADLGAAAARKPGDVRASADRRGANVATIAPVQQAAGGSDAVYALLVELKRDIDKLKHEQHSQPPLTGDAHLYGLLADLKRDIDDLRHEQAIHHVPHGEGQLRGVLAELKRDIAVLRHEQAGQHLPQGEAQLYGVLAELRRDIHALRQEQSGEQLPSAERQLYAMLAEIKREIHDLQHAGHATGASEVEHVERAPVLRQSHFDGGAGVIRLASSRWSVREAATFLPLLAICLIAAYTFMRPAARPVAAPPAAVSQAQPRAPANAVPAESGIADVFSTALTSPRGVSAVGVDASQALARAGTMLGESGAQRDSEEANYWLRRYLALTHGGDRKLTRALTQLGSLYAEPTTSRGPDYASARMLWEMAGALGDPVGMCFLGRLHEHGLGVPPDRALAALWLERARAAGGCDAR